MLLLFLKFKHKLVLVASHETSLVPVHMLVALPVDCFLGLKGEEGTVVVGLHAGQVGEVVVVTLDLVHEVGGQALGVLDVLACHLIKFNN
jgi:hypothetical protein